MRGKAPWKLKGKIQEKKFIFDLEEDTIIYKGYKEYDEIPVSNRFDLLDDRVHSIIMFLIMILIALLIINLIFLRIVPLMI